VKHLSQALADNFWLCPLTFEQQIALPLRKAYEGQLAHNLNLFRWAEFSLSSALMRLQIAGQSVALSCDHTFASGCVT
jgi:Heliorhodopsin